LAHTIAVSAAAKSGEPPVTNPLKKDRNGEPKGSGTAVEDDAAALEPVDFITGASLRTPGEGAGNIHRPVDTAASGSVIPAWPAPA